MDDRFSILSGVVFDWSTGLAWQHRPATIRWLDAEAYATNLMLGDRSGWRLPSVGELCGLLDRTRYELASAFPGLGKRPDLWFWSSERWVGTDPDVPSDLAWFVDFATGMVWTSSVANDHQVRCVHPAWGPGG